MADSAKDAFRRAEGGWNCYTDAMALCAFFPSAGSVLKTVARQFGLETKLLEHQLRAQWPAIAGEQIAAHTSPDQIRFKKLSLIVENSAWLHHLTFLKPALLEKINKAAGEQLVSDLVLRVGEISRGDRDLRRSTFEGERRTQNLELQTELLKEVSAHAAAVTDPALRDHLVTVMARSLTSEPPPK